MMMKLSIQGKNYEITANNWNYISQILLPYIIQDDTIRANIPIFCDDVEVGFCTDNMVNAIRTDLKLV